MKKIVFIVPHMLCGGVEKSLLSLINEIDKDKFSISVLMLKEEGDFVSLIPSYINKGELPISDEVRNNLMLGGIKKSLKHYLKNKEFKNIMKIVFNIVKRNPLATLTESFDKINSLDEKYDIAVCYHIHMPFIVRYVADKINANIKVAWVHNDFKSSGYNVKKLKRYMDKYSHYFCVSEQLKKEFIEIFPQYLVKTSVCNNIISEEYINTAADEYDVVEYKNKKTIKILTIGRLDHQKGYDMAVKVCHNIIKRGYNIEWFVLGKGKEEENIKEYIDKYKLSKNFNLLGVRNNPYPYLKQCDIYVQPSRHEGYGIAVAEARVLNKPIVCTNFTGATEQLVNNITGSIVEFKEEELTRAIIELIDNEDKRMSYQKNLVNDKFNARESIDEVMKYLK